MGNSTHGKNHKKRALARKTRIQHDKNRMEKMKRDFIMNLIKTEQAKGMFNDNPTIEPINSVTIEGPAI